MYAARAGSAGHAIKTMVAGDDEGTVAIGGTVAELGSRQAGTDSRGSSADQQKAVLSTNEDAPTPTPVLVVHPTAFLYLGPAQPSDPGGMGVRTRAAATTQLDMAASDGPVLLIATGPLIAEGFDLPVLDTLFLAAPVSFPGRLVQYAGRVLRPCPGNATAEVHDYVDVEVPVLKSSLTKRARGYTQLSFPDPRRM